MALNAPYNFVGIKASEGLTRRRSFARQANSRVTAALLLSLKSVGINFHQRDKVVLATRNDVRRVHPKSHRDVHALDDFYREHPAQTCIVLFKDSGIGSESASFGGQREFPLPWQRAPWLDNYPPVASPVRVPKHRLGGSLQDGQAANPLIGVSCVYGIAKIKGVT